MLLSRFCTNIATQPNYLACTKTSLICCSHKDVRDFKRLSPVEKHFPFSLPLLSSFHLLQWACFVLLCFVLLSRKTILKENCFLWGSNLKHLSFPPYVISQTQLPPWPPPNTSCFLSTFLKLSSNGLALPASLFVAGYYILQAFMLC